MVKEKPFQSTHRLPFETAGPFRHDPTFTYFRVGTVEGLFGTIGKAYCILAVTNSKPGNGHFGDTLEWFEHSARRDGYTLRIIEIMNARFMEHLIRKRGFKKIDVNAVEKHLLTIKNTNNGKTTISHCSRRKSWRFLMQDFIEGW